MATLTRRTALFLVVLLAAGLAGAATENPDAARVLLQTANQVRLVDGDLVRAIEIYERISTEFGDDRALAAEALLDLGGCYEQLGDPKARRTYERLLREYGDQTRQVGAARTRLAGLQEEISPRVDVSDVIVREVWERPQSSVVPVPSAGFPRFVVFNDLSILRWNSEKQALETQRLSSAARSAAYPVLSPDQKHVAYLSWSGDLKLSFSDGPGPRSWAELRVVGVDGSEDRAVYRSRDTPWLRPLAWTPDGSQILSVLERRDGSSDMAMVSPIDGSTRMIKSLRGRTPSTVGFSRDGRLFAYELPQPRNARQHEFLLVQLQDDPQSRPVERRYVMKVGAETPSSASEDRQIVHVLNRLGFGPRPGDIERVKAMGIEAYIDEQLHPESISDPVVDEKLANFSSLRMELEELLERAGPAAPAAIRARASIFEKRAIAQRRAQGKGRPMDNNMLLPDSDRSRQLLLEGRPYDHEIQTARFFRAVYSERQLQEVIVDFWMNHFNINHGKHQLTAHFEEQVIRRHALGKFEDLLMGVAKHPRMLNYLDNWRSSAPAEVIEERIAALKPTLSDQQYLALLDRMEFLKQAKGINENFARELMELHTLGVDGGYSQQDIIEVSKILTGWTISGSGIVNGREDDGAFAFDPLLHIDGDKVVMGETIRSGGVEEGEHLLGMLARHPSTARFVSTKLARRFVADDPPAQVVDAASRTFLETGGDIREVLRTIFRSAQFRSPESYQAKIKKPLELVVSSLRAVSAEIGDGIFAIGRRGLLARMGERLYNYESPDGNPDVGAAWMNSNALLVRLEFANDLAMGQLPDVKLDLESGQSLLRQLGMTPPTAEQIEQTRAMLEMAAETKSAAGSGMMMSPGGGATDVVDKAKVDDTAIAVAAMLGSPLFQKR